MRKKDNKKEKSSYPFREAERSIREANKSMRKAMSRVDMLAAIIYSEARHHQTSGETVCELAQALCRAMNSIEDAASSFAGAARELKTSLKKSVK